MKFICEQDAADISQMLVDIIDYGKIVTKKDSCITCSIPGRAVSDAEISTISENLLKLIDKDFSYTVYIENGKLFINVYRY